MFLNAFIHFNSLLINPLKEVMFILVSFVQVSLSVTYAHTVYLIGLANF